MTDRKVILTHGDLDGMTCAIMLLGFLKGDPEVTITNHAHLRRNLKELAGGPSGVAEIFITDVPLARPSREHVLASMAQLASQGVRIHLFDHHIGWDDPDVLERLNQCCETVVVDTRKTTAAALVWRELLRGDGNSQRWLKLLSEKDGSSDPWVRERFGLLVALMERENYSKTEPILKALAQDLPLGPEEQALSDWYFSEKVARESAIAEQAKILTASSGRRIGWLDLRSHNQRLHVAPLVVKRHGVDLVVTVVRDGIVVGSEAIDRGVDLTFLHGEHEVNGARMTIAGHRSPVRISPSDRKVTAEFIVAARELLLESL